MTEKLMIRPVRRIVDRIKDIAEGEGDLTARIEVKSRDEVGELGGWFNAFVGNLQQIMRDISRKSLTLSRT